MDKFIKRGLVYMLAAVLLMPVALLLRNINENLTLVVLFLSMLLELIGLIFVIINILKRRRVKNQ